MVRSQRSKTGARRNKREETGGEKEKKGSLSFLFLFFTPLPKPPSARLLQFFCAWLFHATSQLSRKKLLAVYKVLRNLHFRSLKNFLFTLSTQDTGHLQNGHHNSSHESAGIKLLLSSNKKLLDESSAQEFPSHTAFRKNTTNYSSSSGR